MQHCALRSSLAYPLTLRVTWCAFLSPSHHTCTRGPLWLQESFDPDHDGTIIFRELHSLLVRSVQKHPRLEPLPIRAMNNYSLRRKSLEKQDANMFGGVITSEEDVCGQIRSALNERLVRVIDLFRQVPSVATLAPAALSPPVHHLLPSHLLPSHLLPSHLLP